MPSDFEPLARFERATYGLRNRINDENPGEFSRCFGELPGPDADPRAASYIVAGEPDRPSVARSVFGRLLRPVMVASLLAGLVVDEGDALALVGINDGNNNITGFTRSVTPDEAYNFGYSFGQIGQGLNGATGDPAIDQAITNGATDALEVDLERLHSRQTAEELR